MDEQDFQAYIDASNDLFEDSHEDEEEYLTRCVVDVATRQFYLYSNLGDERVIDCESADQFMNVLELVRSITPEGMLNIPTPLTKIRWFQKVGKIQLFDMRFLKNESLSTGPVQTNFRLLRV